MGDYRWNRRELAEQYDMAADMIHPCYREIQDVILARLPYPREASFLMLDIGGGSGRLMERLLEKFSQARGVVLDQSAAFLELAQRRLARFGDRATTIHQRLQDDWMPLLNERPGLVVSMSAIHHLDAQEKSGLFRQIHAGLVEEGSFLNGDEFRAESDNQYLADLQAWAEHMNQVSRSGKISSDMVENLQRWQDRNIEQFDQPRVSGDDCHETVAAQTTKLHEAGFAATTMVWKRQMWAVVRAEKSLSPD